MPNELEVKIKEIIPRTYNVKSFRLDLQNPNFKAGQFLCARLKEEEDCKRYLSISSSPTETNYLEFTKKITDSKFSKALNNYKIGDIIKIQYPLGNFILDEVSNKIAFLSGGIGITPIRSICKYAFDKKLNVDILLLYGNRSLKDIVFKEDFDIIKKEYPNFKVTHVLCESCANVEGRVGIINQEIIKEEIPDYTTRKFYICGPPGMVSAMKNILISELSFKEDSIVTENFIGY
ncbi:MAG: FAD-dependent oxidoreductase [Candidatus Omnitrophota bacterium]